MPTDKYITVDSRRHAYCLWAIPEKYVKEGGKTIIFPSTLFNLKNKFNTGLVRGWSAALYTPVNVKSPYDLWYSSTPVFEIRNPGIYYLGEVSIEFVKKEDRKHINDMYRVDHAGDAAGFKQFLEKYYLADAEFYNYNDKWLEIRGTDFFKYVTNK